MSRKEQCENTKSKYVYKFCDVFCVAMLIPPRLHLDSACTVAPQHEIVSTSLDETEWTRHPGVKAIGRLLFSQIQLEQVGHKLSW